MWRLTWHTWYEAQIDGVNKVGANRYAQKHHADAEKEAGQLGLRLEQIQECVDLCLVGHLVDHHHLSGQGRREHAVISGMSESRVTWAPAH